MPSVGKDKLPRANLEQKIMIIDHFHNSKRPQSETVDFFRDQFSISTSSFSEWLKNEAELRLRYREAHQADSATSKSMRSSKRKLSFKYEPINRAMHKVVEDRLAQNLPITEPILREYWAKFAREYGVDDPKRLESFSHGWLSTFKRRHGLFKKQMRMAKTDANTSMRGSEPSSTSSTTANGNTDPELSNIMPSSDYSYPSTQPPNYDHQLTQPQPAFSNTRQQQQRHDQAEQHEYLLMESNENNAAAQTSTPTADRYQPYEVGQMINNSGPNGQSRSLATPSVMSFTPKPPHQQQTQPATHNGSFNSASAQFQSQISGYLPMDNRFPVAAPRQPRAEANEPDFGVDIADMEKLLFVYSERFFQQYGYQFSKSKEIFDAFKTKFMEEKLIYSSNGPKHGSTVDEMFMRRIR
ncbi:hypothetical protein OGAPHI_005260 [Ogataea philodendri]|uniref:HTH CENPB-type domain-containing protein n=1 Tax=Ogataea philodendri TaxID=1378263 RepID=A0A9P8P267_9ASCO|nr:uncharacterized protein OGAPHI_005260 [Ogataea philodendri]KAH3663857.1 hypothetical protein OGAPHI_005260 [Ogataea philodendri]